MNVGEMQRKLSLWATEHPNHSFGDLYSLMYDRDWLRLAHDHVMQNSGSITAGCDGITMSQFDENLAENLQKMFEELKAQQFEPQPTRRVYLQKTNGKLRPLGIPAIRDRIVQEALRMILEPIYEADFSPYSFGFRPNRCTMDAIKCITWSTQAHKKFFWVIEGDISSYFDSICHRKLIKLLRHRIKDKKLLNLIWKFLKAGVMEHKLFRDTQTGVPQGGILSPLLANVYLHQLDQYMERHTQRSLQERVKRRQQGLGNAVYIRYADDWVVLLNGTKAEANALKQELSEFLQTHLKLRLSDEKTQVTHLNEGFQFLGFVIQRKMGHKGMTTKVEIPREAMRKVLGKLRASTASSTYSDSVITKILALNRIYGGWCRYYQYTSNASQIFGSIHTQLFWLLAHWLGGKFRLKMPQVMRQYLDERGLGNSRYKLMKPPKTQHYQRRFLKPNPYLTQTRIHRENSLDASEWRNPWSGFEVRPGMADLRPLVLQRDRYTCQACGSLITSEQAQVDHIRPVRRFKLPIHANRLENLQTLCISCHHQKTETDRQMESRIH